MTSSFITTLGQVAELIAEFRLLQERDSVSPETLGFILRRIVDLTEQGIVPVLDNQSSGLSQLTTRLVDVEIGLGSAKQSIKNLDTQLSDINNRQGEMAQTIYKVTQIATCANTEALQAASRLDAIVGENASEAIDNFNEILSFLDGVKDDESLLALLSDIHSDIEANREAIDNLRESGGGIFDVNAGADANSVSIVFSGNHSITEIELPIAEAPSYRNPGSAGVITASDYHRISQLPTSEEIDQLRLDISAATPTVSMEDSEVVEVCNDIFKKQFN